MTLTENQSEARAQDRDAERSRIRSGVRYALLVFLGVRLGLAVLAVVGVGLLPHVAPYAPVGVKGWPAPPYGTGPHVIVTSWERFDALWFLRIASGGYVNGDGSAAFFPLYPMLIRGLSWVIGGHPLAAEERQPEWAVPGPAAVGRVVEPGRPGPGEITIRSGFMPAMPSTVAASFLTTWTLAPSSPRYWTRL